MRPRRAASVPRLPRRASALPQLFQFDLVAEGVHRLPEAVVSIGGQLAVARERFEWRALPHAVVAVDIGERAGFEHEEAAVDPAAVALRLLGEARDAMAVDVERAESTRRLYRADGGEGAALAMESEL